MGKGDEGLSKGAQQRVAIAPPTAFAAARRAGGSMSAPEERDAEDNPEAAVVPGAFPVVAAVDVPGDAQHLEQTPRGLTMQTQKKGDRRGR